MYKHCFCVVVGPRGSKLPSTNPYLQAYSAIYVFKRALRGAYRLQETSLLSLCSCSTTSKYFNKAGRQIRPDVLMDSLSYVRAPDPARFSCRFVSMRNAIIKLLGPAIDWTSNARFQKNPSLLLINYSTEI